MRTTVCWQQTSVRAARCACNRAVVELTTDGGRTSHVVFRAPATLNLQTVGSDGAIASTATGKAWRTLNGGRTWQRFHSRFTVDWLDPRVGVRFRSYDVHDHGALAMLVTRDGGITWERSLDPCKRSVTFRGVADLVTPKLWWVACVGEGAAGNEDKAIFRTRDGGQDLGGRCSLRFHRLSPTGARRRFELWVSRCAQLRPERLGASDRKPRHALRLARRRHALPRRAERGASGSRLRRRRGGVQRRHRLRLPRRGQSAPARDARFRPERGRSCGAGASRASPRRRGRARRASFHRPPARGCRASRATARRRGPARPRPPCPRP